jgi:hypothetical protein
MSILRRILFVIVYAISLPIYLLCGCLILPLGIAAVFIYISKGDMDGKLIDMVTCPIEWGVNLPYKVMGYN